MKKHFLFIIALFSIANTSKAADGAEALANSYAASVDLVRKNTDYMTSQAPKCGMMAKRVAASVNEKVSALDAQKKFVLTYPGQVVAKMNLPQDLSGVNATNGSQFKEVVQLLKKAKIADDASTEVNKNILVQVAETNKAIKKNAWLIEPAIQNSFCPKPVFLKYKEARDELVKMEKTATDLKAYYTTQRDALRKDSYAKAESNHLNIQDAVRMTALP